MEQDLNELDRENVYKQMCEAVYDNPNGKKLIDMLVEDHATLSCVVLGQPHLTYYKLGRQELVLEILRLATERGTK